MERAQYYTINGEKKRSWRIQFKMAAISFVTLFKYALLFVLIAFLLPEASASDCIYEIEEFAATIGVEFLSDPKFQIALKKTRGGF